MEFRDCTNLFLATYCSLLAIDMFPWMASSSLIQLELFSIGFFKSALFNEKYIYYVTVSKHPHELCRFLHSIGVQMLSLSFILVYFHTISLQLPSVKWLTCLVRVAPLHLYVFALRRTL